MWRYSVKVNVGYGKSLHGQVRLLEYCPNCLSRSDDKYIKIIINAIYKTDYTKN